MEGLYNPFISLYSLSEDNIRIFIRDFYNKGILPNTGDIIEVDSEKYEVLKRRINYNKVPPLVSLYVSYYDL